MDTLYSANVYKSEKLNNKYEYLTEIGLFIETTEGVEIYANPNNDSINDAFLIASYTGSNALETGYHTLKLPAPLQIKGEKFVILVKYINSDTDGMATIPIECNLFDTGLTTESEDIYNKAKSNSGESFISTDGTTWKDLYDYAFGNYTIKNTNACIKAMTEYTDELLAVPVNSVELDKTNLSMEVGDKITLVCTINPTYATNKSVIWTSSDENVATVNNGIVTANKEGTATITVKSEDGNKTATSKITVNKKTNKADDIYKDGIDTKAGQTINEKLETSPIKSNDNTVANTILPYTGATTMIITICISIIAIIVGIKLKSLKDIK